MPDDEEEYQKFEQRIDKLEKANSDIRFVFGIARWAAGALLMMLVFVVNQCSENSSSIKTNVIKLDSINEKLSALDKRIEVNYNQTLTNLTIIQANVNKLEGVAEKLQDLDKRATVNRETEYKDIGAIKEGLSKAADDLQKQIDTLSFQLQLQNSPATAIKRQLKSKANAAQ